MAVAIMKAATHRCSLERALHGVDVMTVILKSGESGKFVELQTTCRGPRPKALGVEEAKGSLPK